MFGLGFLNGAFLAGLAAAAIPVLIHLLNRRRTQRVRFSSLRFLDEQARRRMRRVSVRRLVVLALRTLAVIALAMAFARPTLRGVALLPGSRARNLVVCLDASASMGVDLADGTAFTRAREIARRLIDGAGRDDRVDLVVFGARAEAAVESVTRNHALVRSAVDGAGLTAEVTSVRAALDRARALIEASDVAGGEVFVVSDLRWVADSTVVDPSSWPRDVRLVFVPVYQGAVDNVTIERVLVPRKLLRPGEVVRVGAVVTNRSRGAEAAVTLDLTIEGSRKAQRVLTLAPGATETVTFPVSFTRPGRYHGSVSCNHDRLRVDDDRWFFVDVSRSVPVTIVHAGDGGSASAPDTTSGPPPAFFVEKALDPRGTSAAEFTVRRVRERELTASSLPARGVVVWVSPRRPQAQRVALLERFVRRGGGLLVFLGDGEGAERSARLRELLGLRGVSRSPAGSVRAWTSLRTDHPVFEVFSRDELRLLADSHVRRYARVRGVSPDSVLAWTGSGDPAMWETARGRGRVLGVALAPDLAHGDVPLSPMFLPLVHTSVSYLASVGVAQRTVEHVAGDPLVFDVPDAAALDPDRLVVRDPAGEPLAATLFTTPSGQRRVLCDRPSRAGFYRLMRDTVVVAQAAVNVDPRETNLLVSLADSVGTAIARRIDVTGDIDAAIRAARQGREVYAAFVLVALAALVAESLLGRRP